MARVRGAAQPAGERAQRPRPRARRARHRLRAELARGRADPRGGARGGRDPGADEPPARRRGGRLHPRPLRRARGLRERGVPARRRAGAGGRRPRARLDRGRRGAAGVGAPCGRPARGGRPGAAARGPGAGDRRLDDLHGRHDGAAPRGAPARRRSRRHPPLHGGLRPGRAGARAPRGGAAPPLGAGRLRAVHARLRRLRGRHAALRRRRGAPPDRAAPLHEHVHGADARAAHRGPAGGRPGALRRVLDAGAGRRRRAVPDAREGGGARVLRPGPLRVLRIDRARHQHDPPARGRAAEARLVRARGAGSRAGDPRRRRPPGAGGHAGRALRAPLRGHVRRLLQGRGGDAAGRAGRVGHGGRRRLRGRRGVRLHLRQEARHDHLGRRQHLPGRDRGRAPPPPGDRGRRGVRRARRRLGRARPRRGAAARRRG